MHGKITYYSSQNGLGTITNKNKRVFELTKKCWHDAKTIPSAGMYVVFRYDEKEGITDCKASYIQSFEDNMFLKESDFWESEDDDALQDIEERRQEDLIIQEMGKIDLKKLKIVKPNKSIASCLQNHFRIHVEAIEKNSHTTEGRSGHQRLDYFLVKRFLDKALTQLLFMDKRISMDDFNSTKKKIVELEYLYHSFVKGAKTTKEELIEDVFLKYQITYLAIKKKLQTLEEKAMVFEAKLKSLESEIASLEEKIKNAQDGDGVSILKAKLESKKNDKEKALQGGGEQVKIYKKVDGFCNKFMDFHTTELPKAYNEMKNHIKNELRRIIDCVAYDLDYTIWKKAMSSDSVEGTFYKQDVDGSFCAMTFLRYYLKRLDKNKMQQSDKILYGLMLDYDKNRSRRFVVVSESFGVSKKIKLFILSSNKDYRVVIINRPIELYNAIKTSRYDVAIVDKNMKSIDPIELMDRARRDTVNKKLKFILFDE